MAEQEEGSEADPSGTDDAPSDAETSDGPTDSDSDAETNGEGKADEGGSEGTSAPSDDSDAAVMEGGLDVEAERGRLDEVDQQIEEGRRALADIEEDTDPEPDGPPVAAGEGAANAPPG